MIDDGVVLYAYRAPLVAAHAAADLPPAVLGALVVEPALRRRPQPRAQERERGHAVVVLRARRLAAHLHAGGLVREQDDRRRLVALLPAGAGAHAHHPDELAFVDTHLGRARLGEHGDGDGAGVHAPAL